MCFVQIKNFFFSNHIKNLKENFATDENEENCSIFELWKYFYFFLWVSQFFLTNNVSFIWNHKQNCRIIFKLEISTEKNLLSST